MMRRAMLAADPTAQVEIVDDELQALSSLLPEVVNGALVVIFYEHLEPIAALVTEAGGTPVAGPGPFGSSGRVLARAQRLLTRTQPPKRVGPHAPGEQAIADPAFPAGGVEAVTERPTPPR